jgi:hypothetical protein
MSREERHGDRDLAFSRWHRAIPRDDLTWIDIDHHAYCDRCKNPLYLFELARDVGQEYKATVVTRRAAELQKVPALLVLYTTTPSGEVERFRVRQVSPTFTDFVTVTPAALQRWIERKHDDHVCAARLEVAA